MRVSQEYARHYNSYAKQEKARPDPVHFCPVASGAPVRGCFVEAWQDKAAAEAPSSLLEEEA